MNQFLIIAAIIIVLAIVGMLFILAVLAEAMKQDNKRNGHDNGTDDPA